MVSKRSILKYYDFVVLRRLKRYFETTVNVQYMIIKFIVTCQMSYVLDISMTELILE